MYLKLVRDDDCIFILSASSDDRWSRLARRQVLPGVGTVADSRQALPSPHLWSI